MCGDHRCPKQADILISPPDSENAELDNFVETFKLLRPKTTATRIGGVEIFGDSVFLNGAVGGDHLILVDFEKRYDLENRIQVAEQEGD